MIMPTKKEECYEFYNSWQWPKISFNSFYQQYSHWRSLEEAITPKTYTRRKSYFGKWAEENRRYDEAPEPKAEREWYRNRLNAWYPKEQAILVWEKRMEAREAKRKANPQIFKKPYPRQPRTPYKEDLTWYMINVTYPKEVARVFRKTYHDMIAQIERELTYTEEKTQVSELSDKLARLEWELEIFNSYNK